MKKQNLLLYLARLAGCSLICLLLVSNGYSQEGGTVSVTVNDEHGGRIVGADVELESIAGLRRRGRTDANGLFSFMNVSPGKYLIEVEAEGFSKTISDQINITSGSSSNVNLELRVAAVSENVVVTATGTLQRTDEVAKVVSTIDAPQLETRHALSLTEALRGTPGVRIQQQGSPGSLTSVRLRGQRSFDTALLLDGLRVRDASDINGSAVSLFTDLMPIALDHVEVLRGSGSSLYGTNAIGGVINLVPASESGGPHFQAAVEGGSLGTFREQFRLGGGNARFGYSAALSRVDVRRGIDGNDEYGNTAAGSRILFNFTPSISIAGNFYATIANARINDSPFALPAAFSGTPFPKAVAGLNFQPDFNNPDQGRRNRMLIASVKLSWQVTDRLSYTIAYQQVASNRRNYNGPAIDPKFQSFYPFGDFEFFSLNKGNTGTFDARIQARLNDTNLATAGFEYEGESFFQQSLPSFSSFNNTTDRQRTFALFGQDQLFFLQDRLQISLGVRGQFFRLRSADRPGFLNEVRAVNSITGDGAIAYLIRTTNTKLRAHVGNGFRAPSLFERFGAGTFPGAGLTRFGDPTLRAEQSISFDLGIDQRLARDRVLIGATYFYTRLQRAITFQNFAIDPLGLGRLSGYANGLGGLSRGSEVFAELTPFRGTAIRASHTFTNSDRATTDRGLQREYVIPNNLIGLSLNQRYHSLTLDLQVNRTGSYLAPIFENNFPGRTAELQFSGYTKADLFASFRHSVSDSVTAVVYGGVENLLGRNYYENGFLAAGAIGRMGVSIKF